MASCLLSEKVSNAPSCGLIVASRDDTPSLIPFRTASDPWRICGNWYSRFIGHKEQIKWWQIPGVFSLVKQACFMKDNTLRRCRQDIKAARGWPGLTLCLRLWRLYHNLCLCTCVLCATVFDHIYLIFWLEIVQMRISRPCFWLCQLQSLDSLNGISHGSSFKKSLWNLHRMTNQTLTDSLPWYFLHTVALIC